MKIIETRLTEQEFLERMEKFCQQKERFDKGYSDRETFVYARKEQKFWLGRHFAHAGRSDGFANDRVNGKYTVSDQGLVTVSYRFGKHPLLMIPHLISFVAGAAIAVPVIDKAIGHEGFYWRAGLFALCFLIFGVIGLFSSRKEKASQEEHLQYICGVLAEKTAEGVPAEAETVDVSLINDGDVYPIVVESQGTSYLTLYYYTADGDGVLNDGQDMIYFKDEAQMQRFCLSHKLNQASEEAVYRFDAPVDNARDHRRILGRWNLLNTMSQTLQIPYEGSSEAHDELYEHLFSRGLPSDEPIPFTDFDEAQVAELNAVFEDKDALLTRFRLYREG